MIEKLAKLQQETLTDFRCPRCHALLFKASDGKGMIQVKCRKCSYMVWTRLKEREQV